MKFLIALTAVIAAVSDAAPAIVWTKQDASSTTEHASDISHISSVISSAIGPDGEERRKLNNSPSSLESVIFLVARDEDGSEALSRLASTGGLPTVADRYGSADAVHHHVSGLESSRTVSRAAAGSMEVSLAEFNRRLSNDVAAEEPRAEMSKDARSVSRRTRQLASATVLVVNAAPSEAATLDAAVHRALDSEAVQSVVLASVRSTEEVKRERTLLAVKRQSIMKTNAAEQQAKRRRLEDQGDDANNNNNNEDLEGIYYVSMTPNILAGILFLFFFIATTYVGMMCMGMIQGGDVYTDKYPVIGREA